MKNTKLKVLFLEDSIEDKELICELLNKTEHQFEFLHVLNETDYKKALFENHFDLILSDFSLNGFNAFEALRICQSIYPETPFICISGSIGGEMAIELLKLGAVDYVLKERPERLPFAIQRALNEVNTKNEILKTAKELAESEEKFRNIFQHHAAAKLLIEAETGNIVAANQAAAQFYGWSIDELKNMKIFHINTLDSELLKKEMVHVQNSNKNQFEFVHKKSDGSFVDVEVFSSSITINNKNFLHSIIHDISDKKKILRDLITAKESAEESDQLKTAFINNISHEIRTPLNSIIGFGQFLAEPNLPEKERAEMFSHLHQSSLRLMNTVDDYVDMAMIVSSSLPVHKKGFSLQSFFEDFITQIYPTCKQNNIDCIFDTPSDNVTIYILSDRELLNKVLIKILDNAIKFTHNGTITIGYSITDQNIEFYIKDTGKGISPEKLELIFKMFTQEESSMTRGYEGSGLGLAIAKGILELLDGQILVESIKGFGSTFFVRIPNIPCYENQNVGINYIVEKIKTPFVLIAEDDELNYQYLQTILKRQGIKYLHVMNGLDAVALCKECPDITIVFMDIKMPILNGIEATKQIKTFRKELPVIATTAYAQTGDKERFISIGCDDYLAKPIKKDQLIAYIEKYSLC
jgi:PAS domain S-box-containing protein